MAKYQELSPNALGIALAILGLIMSLLGSGMMGYSMMGYAYNPLGGIVVMTIAGYVAGWLAAWLYNWALKRK